MSDEATSIDNVDDNIPENDAIIEETGDDNSAEDQENTSPSPEEEEAARQAKIEKRQARNNRRATAHIRKIETELAQLREENAFLRGRDSGRGQNSEQNDPEPDPDDYESPKDYSDDLKAWADRQPLDDEPETNTRQQQGNRQQEQAPAFDMEAVAEYQKAGKERFGDEFTEMMEAAANNEWDASPLMADYVINSEKGPEIAMYLYDNPEEATRIAKMRSATAQFNAMQKVADEVQAKVNGKRVSKAPEPTTPVKTGASGAEGTDLSKPMSAARYREIRRRQLAKQRPH